MSRSTSRLFVITIGDIEFLSSWRSWVAALSMTSRSAYTNSLRSLGVHKFCGWWRWEGSRSGIQQVIDKVEAIRVMDTEGRIQELWIPAGSRFFVDHIAINFPRTGRIKEYFAFYFLFLPVAKTWFTLGNFELGFVLYYLAFHSSPLSSHCFLSSSYAAVPKPNEGHHSPKQ